MHSDLIDLLKAFNGCGVRYLVVGAYAVMEYTEPRYTKDLDVWVKVDPANAEAIFHALAEFKAPLNGISPADFLDPDVFYQIGVSPFRVDVLTSIVGVDFEECWARRELRLFDGVEAPVISREDLIRNKQAAGRPVDRIDVRALKGISRKRKKSNDP